MTINDRQFYTLVKQAKSNVPEFFEAYAHFIQRVSIDQKSKSCSSIIYALRNTKLILQKLNLQECHWLKL
jgi:hypothetical protein